MRLLIKRFKNAYVVDAHKKKLYREAIYFDRES